MRKQLLGLATFGFFLTLTVASVQAQTGARIVANIPFDFSAGETSLRAGIYRVELISRNVLLFRSSDGKKNVLLLARQAQHVGTQKPVRIIFNRYGDRYFLSRAFLRGTDLGIQVNPSRAERVILRGEDGLAERDAKSQKVEVALR